MVKNYKGPCVEPDGTPCLSRHPGCQNPKTCERYAAFRAELDRKAAERETLKALNGFCVDSAIRMTKAKRGSADTRRKAGQR